MPPTRPHRIVRRAVMALAVPPMLLAWYVGSYFAVQFGMGAGWLPNPQETSPHHLMYRPIVWYILDERLGGQVLNGMLWDTYNRGRSLR